jgi:uncharacterized protein (TIGR03067 family)
MAGAEKSRIEEASQQRSATIQSFIPPLRVNVNFTIFAAKRWPVKAHWLIVLACGLLMAAYIVTNAGKEKRPMNVQEQIQGTWRLMSAVRDGKTTPEDIAVHIRLVFDGDKLLTRNKDRVTEAKFRLDPDKKPSEIDLDMDGQVGHGIYVLQGDSLKIVHGEVGDARPTEFTATPGSGLTLLVLKRDKA